MEPASERAPWQRELPVSQRRQVRQVLLELRERLRLAWEDWMYQRVERAC